jgi:hypothetical protein
MEPSIGSGTRSSAGEPPAAPGGNFLVRILVIALFAALFFAYTTPACDSDCWWHLATGRWIIENRSLPHVDPFDCTSALFGASGQVRYQLTQYWLAQTSLYLSFLAAGLKGVVLLRGAVFTALFVCLYRLLRRSGAGVLLSALLVALAAQAIVFELRYIHARPQMWSSLFFVALLLLLEHLRSGEKWARFVLPPFLLLWANLHGGYILGVIVIAITTATLLVQRHPEGKRMLFTAAVAVALTGCNPAVYEALLAYPATRLAELGGAASPIFEEQSLFSYWGVLTMPWEFPGLAAAGFLPLLTFGLGPKALLRERRDLLLVYLLTLGLGIKAYRFLVFLVPLSCWVTALNLVALRQRLPPARWQAFARRVPLGLPALTAAVLLSLTAAYVTVAAKYSELRPSASLRHPATDAADYLERNRVTGNLFNEYGLGGYLAWRLHPEMKVFIYGRMVYPELYRLYKEVVNRPATPVPVSAGKSTYRYKRVFDENAIDAVVMPAADGRSGTLIPLSIELAQDSAWALVSAEPAALVFLRRTPAVAALTAAALPKTAVYDTIISIASTVSQTPHGQAIPVWRLSLAVAYYRKGQKREALTMVDEYLSLAPRDPRAIEFRNAIVGELAGENR